MNVMIKHNVRYRMVLTARGGNVASIWGELGGGGWGGSASA